MRLTGPAFARAASQTHQKQAPSTQSTRFAFTSMAVQNSDSFVLSRPRFGASQGGGTEVDNSAGAYAAGAPGGDDGEDKKRGSYRKPLPEDAKPIFSLPDNWDALLRKAMREEVKKNGKKADVNTVIHKFERQYGQLPTHVLGTRSTSKAYSLSEQLRRTKEDYLRTNKRTDRSTSDTKSTKWTPCNLEGLKDKRNTKKDSSITLPSFSDIASQAGTESHLSTGSDSSYHRLSMQPPANQVPYKTPAPPVPPPSPDGWRYSRDGRWKINKQNGVYDPDWTPRTGYTPPPQ